MKIVSIFICFLLITCSYATNNSFSLSRDRDICFVETFQVDVQTHTKYYEILPACSTKEYYFKTTDDGEYIINVMDVSFPQKKIELELYQYDSNIDCTDGIYIDSLERPNVGNDFMISFYGSSNERYCLVADEYSDVDNKFTLFIEYN